MSITLSTRQQIVLIDRDIDAVRRELRGLEKIDPLSYISWGEAWAKHPDLADRQLALFRQRGDLQVQRDTADHAASMKAARAVRFPKAKPCPACKGSGFAQAA